jgi:hypothetical protein
MSNIKNLQSKIDVSLAWSSSGHFHIGFIFRYSAMALLASRSLSLFIGPWVAANNWYSTTA